MGKEYPINVRLLGVRMSSLEQKLPENKNQKQLNDFWKVKKDKTMKNESVDKMDKVTISKLFEKQKEKVEKKARPTLICPICNLFECVTNLQLNIHLDQCLKPKNKKKKKRKIKKSKKGTLNHFFRPKN